MTPNSQCVTCVTVRHDSLTHPLTCGFTSETPRDALQGASEPRWRDARITSPQVSDCFQDGKCECVTVRQNPVTHPLTCGNVRASKTDIPQRRCAATLLECVTALPYGVRAHTHARPRAPAYGGAHAHANTPTRHASQDATHIDR